MKCTFLIAVAVNALPVFVSKSVKLANKYIEHKMCNFLYTFF
jgi:hypothetical protein